MLADAQDLPDGHTIRADVCVVGAGAAGITIARRLSGRGLRIVLLEGGGLDASARSQSLYQGEVTGRPYFELDEARLRYLGGTTNHWAGWCGPLHEIDLEQRDWVPDSGWPVSMADLRPYYEQAHSVLELGPYDYSPQRWVPAGGPSHLGLDEARVASMIVQFSPPTRFGTRYRNEIEQAEDIEAYLHANVVAIETQTGGARVARVRIARFDRTEVFAAATHFVLAMGGIENPRLLLASRQADHSGGVGNGHDLVGRYFMEHVRVPVGTIFGTPELGRRAEVYLQQRDADEVRIRALLTLSDELQAKEKLLALSGVMGQARTSEEEDLHRSDLAEGIGVLAEGLHERSLDDPYGIDLAVEQAPNPNSRVTLGRARDALGLPRVELEWRLDPLVERTLRRGTELVAAELARAGFGRLRSDIHAGPLAIDPVFHHMGTTRMSADPAAGVVNEDCRVHGVENLSVAGSSVFPTGGHSGPTLTIVALAIRLADHLLERVQ